MQSTPLQVGQRIRVYQEIDRREGNWAAQVEGVIVNAQPQKTGSWFAHGKDDKLWLNRITLRKNDGELTTIAVDSRTRYEVLA